MTKHEAETFVFILSVQLINNNMRTGWKEGEISGDGNKIRNNCHLQ